MEFEYKKILIVGCGGSGGEKRILANKIKKLFDIAVEFDVLLKKEMLKDFWITDGTFSKAYEIKIQEADLCIFLDYSPDLCLNNIENNVFIDWYNNYNENVRPVMFDLLEKSNVTYLIFKSREETKNWLDAISN